MVATNLVWSSAGAEHSPLMVTLPDSNIQVPIYVPEVQLDDQLHYSLQHNPPWHEAVTMAFQHVIVMLGMTVMISTKLVHLMGGNDEDKAIVIQTLLFTSGLNTLLQTLIGTRLPTVMSASTTFIIPVMSIIKDMSKYRFTSEHERFVYTMRSIQGALIISSMFNILIGYSKAWGYFTRFLSPVSIIPIICLGGLSKFRSGFPQLGECIEIGLPMLILLVISQQYMKFIGGRKNATFEKFGVLFSVAVVWAFAALLTVSGAYNHVSEQTKFSCRVDRSNLMSASRWIRIPYPFQWGAPIFKASPIFGMIGAALVSTSESTGTYYAASRFSGATPPPTNVLTRSVGLQGLGMLFDGLFGAVVGTDVSVENVGLLGITRVGSRRVVQISTIFMVFFSIFGKFGAFFASIPFPIFAAMHCVLFGHISAAGISYIQFTNNNSQRNLYTIGLSLFLGISIPQYFNDATNNRGRVNTAGLWFNNILNTTFSSGPTVVTAFGTVLDNTLDTKGTAAAYDRGMLWWSKFQNSDPTGVYRFPPPLSRRPRPCTQPPPPSPPRPSPPPPPPPSPPPCPPSPPSCPPSPPPKQPPDITKDIERSPLRQNYCPHMNSSSPCGEYCRHVHISAYPYVEDCPHVFPRVPCIQM
ncbi:nucleobase-ascorbate transporter 3-like isoform X1 [Papaver somniferum]|uniref:nucleobase-ascorbate transporter 3-like isoform X1 n=2 Tax=Papaver somniferum TaxID=3469 RepID=UPI000E7011D6|nr:nucleobase-ascorbate transporter 3-like isoform X1 [Papaver somniferum]